LFPEKLCTDQQLSQAVVTYRFDIA